MTILPCNRGHIPGVVELLGGRRAQDDPVGHAGMCRYFGELFFDNPWHDPDLPALVCEHSSGRIDGFLGVMPRPMALDGKPVRAALACNLRVRAAEEGRGPGNPWIAVQLVKRFLKGAQDLSVADPVNERARKIFEACGGVTMPLYSLDWLQPIRPARALLEFARSRSPGRILPLLADAADLVGARIVGKHAASRGSKYRLDALDDQFAVDTLGHAPGFDLRPRHDAASFEWSLRMARRLAVDGCFRTATVIDDTERRIGWFVYLRVTGRVAWVLQLVGLDGHRDTVLRAAIQDAAAEGLALLRGVVSVGDLKAYHDTRCLLHGGRGWMLAHSREPRLVDPFLRGRALFTGLDGERWMRRDRQGWSTRGWGEGTDPVGDVASVQIATA